MIPCCLCNLNLSVGAPEEDEIEIVVTGMCVAVDDSQPSQSSSVSDTPVTAVSSKSLLRPGKMLLIWLHSGSFLPLDCEL